MAANQYLGALCLGFDPANPGNGTNTYQLNSGTTWFALGFVPDRNVTLSSVAISLSAVAGAPIAANFPCYLCPDSAGTPNTAGAFENQPMAAGPTAGQLNTWTGFSTALTGGVQYWLAVKNSNGTPATNNITFKFGGTQTGVTQTEGGAISYGWSKQIFNGSTWGATGNADTGLRVGYSDGSYDGLPVTAIGATAAANRAYSSQELGVQFTTPANAVWNVRGVSLYVGSVGSPTGNCQLKLYTGSSPSLQATANAIAAAQITAGGAWVTAYFSADQVINPGTVVTLTIANSNADAQANSYNCPAEYTVDTGQTQLFPMGGTLQRANYNGTTWSYTASSFMPFALVLDTAGEFAPGMSWPQKPRRIIVPVRSIQRRPAIVVAGGTTTVNVPYPAARRRVPVRAYYPSPRRQPIITPAASLPMPMPPRRLVVKQTSPSPRRPPVITPAASLPVVIPRRVPLRTPYPVARTRTVITPAASLPFALATRRVQYRAATARGPARYLPGPATVTTALVAVPRGPRVLTRHSVRRLASLIPGPATVSQVPVLATPRRVGFAKPVSIPRRVVAAVLPSPATSVVVKVHRTVR